MTYFVAKGETVPKYPRNWEEKARNRSLSNNPPTKVVIRLTKAF
jgi:hypothetical protein